MLTVFILTILAMVIYIHHFTHRKCSNNCKVPVTYQLLILPLTSGLLYVLISKVLLHYTQHRTLLEGLMGLLKSNCSVLWILITRTYQDDCLLMTWDVWLNAKKCYFYYLVLLNQSCVFLARSKEDMFS